MHFLWTAPGKRHLMQLALANNARRRQPVENAPGAHAHAYMVFARASELKENVVVRERRTRERENFFWENQVLSQRKTP